MTVKIFAAPYSDDFKALSQFSDNGDGYMKGKYFFTSERGSWYGSDWLIVNENPYACFYTDIPKERRILFITEPPEILEHKNFMYYLEQFGHVVNISEIPGYSGNMIISNPKLGWFAGLNGDLSSYGKAMNYNVPEKSRLISVISSLKHKTEYHKKRVAFMRELQKEFSGIIDCYGRGFNPIDDKLNAIAPYKYHVVMENSIHENYWTEKLMDSWACWALPIYCGDPEIIENVPDKKGIEIIDINDVTGSIKKIHEIIDGGIYSSRIEAVKKCRQWALKKSNMYEAACEIIEKYNNDVPKLKTPELFKRMLSSRKNFVYKILNGIFKNKSDKIFERFCRLKGRFWE